MSTSQNHAHRRAVAPRRFRGLPRGLRRAAVGTLCASALALPVAATTVAAQAQTTASFTALTLQNGWTNAPFGTSDAAAEVVSGIVHLKGAIATTGTNQVPFTLPKADRPATAVYVQVDMCDATNGRLFIQPNGVVTVDAGPGNFANAQCFTSLDGATFAKSATSFTALTLQNGWTNAPFSTSDAAVRTLSGIVHFKGAINTSGTNAVPFTLPAAFRPATNVFIPVDLCNATNGRLDIQNNGTVTVEAEDGTFTNAQCFTSLDGVSFAKSASSFTGLTLRNGWTSAPFGTSNTEVRTISGIVQLKGAMATTKNNAVAFTLPAGFRPSAEVFVPVDLCGATNGRLDIAPSGVVSVDAEGGTFSNAQCFTSLDGVSFAP
jgi:hypothetical protein